jgi:hypothetical protein
VRARHESLTVFSEAGLPLALYEGYYVDAKSVGEGQLQAGRHLLEPPTSALVIFYFIAKQCFVGLLVLFFVFLWH